MAAAGSGPAAMSDSFDIVSTVDLQEVRNAVGQAEKEIITRYDLKKAAASLKLEGEEVVLETADEFSLGQALEVLKGKLVRRSVNLKSVRYGKVEPASGGRARQRLTFQQGIPIDTAKKIVADLKKMKMKVQAAIQGDTVRISGKKRDDLQEVIAHLKQLDLDVPLTFTNYRNA
jgi:cyclic-di-GMP-binding protein